MFYPGCLSEQSFQLDPAGRPGLVTTDKVAQAADTRDWLRIAHGQLSPLLPGGSPQTLLTEDLTDASGRPVDVFAHFGIKGNKLQSVIGNMSGIRCTAQAASQDYAIETPAPPWPAFEDVWIPVPDGGELAGRLGFAVGGDGRTVSEADCIVILPGLFGDNGVQRTRDLALFLRDSGFHVLALEIRGHGQTEARHPEMCHTFGVRETDELMTVADWLEAKPEILRTGLIGYCWGANVALLAGWYDNHRPDDPQIPPVIGEALHESPTGRRYAAGIIAFSPILRWEVLTDRLDTPRSFLREPINAAIQQTVKDRMERKGYPNPDGSLRRLIEFDVGRCGVDLPGGAPYGYPFLRLMPYGEHPTYDRMERVAVPMLVVHASNDPLSPAQEVADFMSGIENRDVAAAILGGGGHVGFAAWAKEYYFALIADFFDPKVGAAAVRDERSR
jgi:predicted alpha/beta-fold hydrolase